MSVLTVIHKIGDKIISVVTYPFRHSIALAHILRDVKEDTPVTVAALVKLVKTFEALTPDLAHAIADKGFDFQTDLKAVAEIKEVFRVFVNEVLPAIEHECSDLKADFTDAGMVEAAAQLPDVSGGIVAAAPGLHNSVPA